MGLVAHLYTADHPRHSGLHSPQRTELGMALGTRLHACLAWRWRWPAGTGSVMALAPGPDPRQGRANPLEQGNSGGQAMYLFFLGLLPPLPALAVVLSGTLLENDLLRWTGSLVGLVTGIGVACGLAISLLKDWKSAVQNCSR